MVQELQQIHAKNFSHALTKIEKNQKRYKKQYDRRNKVQKFKFKVGDKIQYQRYLSKSPMSKLPLSKWVPFKSYYLILKINLVRKTVILQTPEGKMLKRHQTFDRIRKFKGKL